MVAKPVRHKISWLTAIIIMAFVSGIQAQTNNSNGQSAEEVSYTMVNPSIYNPAKEWSYTPKSSTVIGVPFTPKPVQVTFDGAIYTREAELCFFYGKDNKPIEAFQKTYYQGWIPIVEYRWSENGLNYNIEMFGFALDNEGPENSVQFVKISISNNSAEKINSSISVASRSSAKDHRFGKSSFDEKFNYRFDKNKFIRNDKVVYTFHGEPKLFSVKGKGYEKPFNAKELNIKEQTAVGICTYQKELASGEKVEYKFKFPRVPVSLEKQTTFLSKMMDAGYEVYKIACISFWEGLIEGNGYFDIPEKRVNDSYKAGLVHLILATRSNNDGKKRQGSGLPYDGLFFNDYVDMRRIYDVAGLHQFVDINTQWLLDNQNEKGMFLDPILTHGKEIMASHGQALVSLANHCLYAPNINYTERVYPTIKKAVEWMQKRHNENPNGLMPASTPFDAEMIKGHYTSHNLWCLLGLRDAIRVAENIGNKDDAKSWVEFHESYNKAVLEAIDSSAQEDGYIPTGLYEFITGETSRKGFKEYRTNQDWENMLLIYPTEVLSKDDSRIKGTLSHIRKNKYREGIMTYRNGMHLHQYATCNQANQYIAINDQKHALLDMYHILLHNGSTHEGFENMIEPWGDRDPDPIPAPHAWAAAKISLLIRNMLVREYGGSAGIEKNKRDLYLFSVLSPEWVKPGNKISINNATTEFGKISASMMITKKGTSIKINPSFSRAVNKIAIPVPYFKKIKKVNSDAGQHEVKDGNLFFSPNVREINIEWTDKKIEYNDYQNLLISYREEPGVRWVGGENADKDVSQVTKMNTGSDLVVISPKIGFLFEDEKEFRKEEKFSFELVKQAYLKEYTRRFENYIKAGKKLLIIEAPDF